MAALLQSRVGPSSAIARQITALLDADESTRHSSIEQRLRSLIAAGLDRIPLPGQGFTLGRWQSLARVASYDLALVKLYESHVDALAILREIETYRAPRSGVVYAVWASESRTAPLTICGCSARIHERSAVVLDGRKAWCSGARAVDMALMTAADDMGERWLVEVDLQAPGITIDERAWHAVGMRDSASFDVVCDGVAARIVGGARAYLERPGFWHGGAGVAACWYGAAASIATRVRDLQIGRDDVHALAHLGAIDGALASGRALLRECAAQIDAVPAADFGHRGLRVRSVIADIAESVGHHAARALGPGPLCNDARLARMVADLPIFIRQCRAEHDLVAQSRALLAHPDAMSRTGWEL